MSAARLSRCPVILLLALLAFVPLSPARADSAHFNPPKQFYLALGDSLAFGFQQAKFNAELPNIVAATFDTGYVNDFATMLDAVRPDIKTVNYGCPGESTATFISGSCPWLVAGLHPHDDFASSQMDAALAFLHGHRGTVSPISVDLGSNDLENLLSTCGGATNKSCVSAGLPAVLHQVSDNLSLILGRLREAARYSEIIVLQYYNPYAVADPSSNAIVEALNSAIAYAAVAIRARPADAFGPFNLAAPQPLTLCALTLFCTSLHDIHASDAGYQVIAQRFWAASGYDRLGN